MQNYTGHGWEGKHYKATRSDSSADLTRYIRKQLKELIPTCKFSVSKQDYSGGRSISIALMEAPFKVFDTPNEDLIRNDCYGTIYEKMERWKYVVDKGHHEINQYHLKDDYYLTPEGNDVCKKMLEIAQDFNYDDSDSMMDYFSTNFYLHASIGKWDKPFNLIN